MKIFSGVSVIYCFFVDGFPLFFGFYIYSESSDPRLIISISFVIVSFSVSFAFFKPSNRPYLLSFNFVLCSVVKIPCSKANLRTLEETFKWDLKASNEEGKLYMVMFLQNKNK